MEREPSCELMVFWRVTVGWNEDPPEELEVREGLLWSIETAMLATAQTAQGVEDATRRTCDYDDTNDNQVGRYHGQYRYNLPIASILQSIDR